MKVTAVFNHILIKPVTPASKTKGGIVLPQGQVRELGQLPQGIVLSVGKGMSVNGAEEYSTVITEGDRILFTAKFGDIIIDDVVCHFIGFQHVVAIIED